MVDGVEVENVLRQIRERVRATTTPEMTLVPGDETPAATESAHALARLETTLPTLERASNKLPPLSSYRHGWLARVELWIKRHIKRMTHWYIWEQVNFNAATHSALRDMQTILRLYEQQLISAQSDLRQMREEVDALAANVNALDANCNALAANTDAVAGNVNALTGNVNALARNVNALAANTEYAQQIADARREARERNEIILDEHRVSFRQLALEAGETAVAADRARRSMQIQLDELARGVDEMRAAQAQHAAANSTFGARGETKAT